MSDLPDSMEPEVIIGTLGTIVRLYEGNRNANINALLAQASQLSSDIAALVEAARKLKEAYRLARDSAAALTNYCDESAMLRRCERELESAEAAFRSCGIDAALAPFKE